MSEEIQHTQTTNDSTLGDLSPVKRRGRPAKIINAAEPEATKKAVEEHFDLHKALYTLDAQVEYCKREGKQWLEVEKELLLHLCKGVHPTAGYMIYKNVRLCLPGTAEEIAKKEAMDVSQILFKDQAAKVNSYK